MIKMMMVTKLIFFVLIFVYIRAISTEIFFGRCVFFYPQSK